MRAALSRWLTSVWYEERPVPFWLGALEWVYESALLLRRWTYRRRLFTVRRLPVPVVVVGNLTVGGTGKTPVVSWLVRELAQRGWRPGVAMRGYRGRLRVATLLGPETEPSEVGDEAVLQYKACSCPVAVGVDRAEAGALLIERAGCNVVICDDGLQHWALRRDFEIAVVDGDRRFGNGRLLPAGPLREPAERLGLIDVVIVNGGPVGPGETPLSVTGRTAVSLRDPGRMVDLRSWRGRRVHAVAGIGNPERFFRMLEGLGLEVIRHPLPDHHRFDGAELKFGDGLPVLVTEKDAVKCTSFAGPETYAVPVEAVLPSELVDRIHLALHQIPRARS
jgi:tetraacyldisaccharide 4'-kinase